MKRFTLRTTEASESQTLSGIEHLCTVHPAVDSCERINCGRWRIVRPPIGSNGRPDWGKLSEQLGLCVAAGYLKPSQIGWIEGAGEGKPDLDLDMSSGHTGAIEVKRRGGKVRPAQKRRIERIQEIGGFAVIVDDIDEAYEHLNAWHRQRNLAYGRRA